MKKRALDKKLSLFSLVFHMKGMGGLGLVLGFAGLGAALGLLAVSGWFLTAAGIAALSLTSLHAFNFLQPGALIRLLAIVRTAALYGERIVSHDGVLRLLQFLRLWLFDRLALADRAKLISLGSGNLMQAMLSDIDLLDQWPIRGAAPWLWALGLNLALFLFLLIDIPNLALVFGIFLFAVFGILPLAAPWKNLSLSGRSTEQAALRRQYLLEALSGLLTLKTTGAFAGHFKKFKGLDEEVLSTGWKLSRHQILLQTLILIFLFTCLWLLLVIGANIVEDSLLDAAILAGLSCALLGMVEVLLPLSKTFQALGFTLKARKRLLDLAGEPGPEKKSAPPFFHGELRFEAKNLSARQAGALTGPEEVSFSLGAGDILWVDGPSGCGKTTLALVLSGWLAPKEGSLLFCGIPLSELGEEDLHRAVGFLEQTPHIFPMNLCDLLKLAGENLSEEKLREILDFVFLGDWARSLPLGLETPIGEYGRGLSGGQARRLALAQLLLFSPQILILDEPFEGLDGKMAKALLQRLIARQKNGILIVVSHEENLKKAVNGFKEYSFAE